MNKSSSPLTILKLTFNIFKKENKEIFYPFIIIAFINILVLEILHFFPRYPFNVFFGPLVSNLWGSRYLHYPLNLILLPKLFYYAQTLTYLFIGSFLIALTAEMVSCVNNDKPVHFKSSWQRSLPSYVDIGLYSFLSLVLVQCFSLIYGPILKRAYEIQSTSGVYFWIKKTVIYIAPYAHFIYSIFIISLLIYTPVLIILEKKKFSKALLGNFKIVFKSFWLTFMLVLVPTLFYFPIILMQNNVGLLANWVSPDIMFVIVALSILVTTVINILIVASATTFYLYKKERS